MRGDFSRFTFDENKHYSGVFTQQGRVTLDSDLTEQVLIEAHRDAKLAVDTIGYAGAPKHDSGFRVEFSTDGNDLLISSGSYYVEGHLCRIEATDVPAVRASASSLTLSRWHVDGGDFVAGQYVEISSPQTPMRVRLTGADPATRQVTFAESLPANVQIFGVSRLMSYLTQPHQPKPDYRAQGPGSEWVLALPAGRYLAYLEVFEREVSALDDPNIKEPALGGPDTSLRSQTIWQLKIWPPEGSSPAQALPSNFSCSSAVPAWEAATAPSTGLMNARVQPSPSPQPCILPPGAGYRGLENQLYIVEIHQGGIFPADAVDFVWSRENASVVVPITPLPGVGFTVPDGPDDVLGLTNGDFVEQIDDLKLLRGLPGPVFQFQKDATTGLVTLVDPVDPALHPKLRRWEGALAAVSAGWTNLENDIQVNFESGTYKTGDYWLIPARTPTASIDWPVDGAGTPVAQARHGTEHHFSRLGVIVSAGAKYVDDCRTVFPPLTELRAVHTCCTYSVGDGVTHVGDFELIQDAVNHLPPQGGQICIYPGRYEQNVDIVSRVGVRISGCGDRTVVVAKNPAAVFHLAGSMGTKISSLAIEADPGAPGILGDPGTVVPGAGTHRNLDLTLRDLSIRAAGDSAIRLHDAQDVSIMGCRIEMTTVNGGRPGIFLQAQVATVEGNRVTGVMKAMADSKARKLTGSLVVSGLQIAGKSQRIQVVRNLFEGCSGQGITLGSLVKVASSTQGGTTGTTGTTDPNDPAHPCADCETPSNFDQPASDVTNPDLPQLQSEGDLHQITIKHNRINSVGLDGIGAIYFFDLGREWNRFGLIRVVGLRVLRNHIAHVVRRELASIPLWMRDQVAYGGISLSVVEDGLFEGNRIENIGHSGELPTVGCWIQWGSFLRFIGNEILNNDSQDVGSHLEVSAISGRRGGIHIGQCSVLNAVDVSPVSGNLDSSEITGAWRRFDETAVVVEGNSIDVKGGQALFMWCWASAYVHGNRLATHGLGSRTLLDVSKQSGQSGAGDALSKSPLLVSIVVWAAANPEDPKISWFTHAPGNVLFNDNQCTVRVDGGVVDSHTGKEIPSNIQPAIVIGSTDDMEFCANQIDCYITNGKMAVNAHLAAQTSLRVTSNRFKETPHRAMFSAKTTSLMNVTAHNQGNHCFLIEGSLDASGNPQGAVVDTPNHVLTDLTGSRCSGLANQMNQELFDLLN